MKKSLTIFFLMIGIVASSQTFQKKFTWKDNSVSQAKAEWVDLNNDSLLDIQVFAKDNNQKLRISSHKNDNFSKFSLANTQLQDVILNSYAFTDINADNKIDLVVNGSKQGQSTELQLLNNGNFQFTNSIITLPNITPSVQLFVDLDTDGHLDLVTGGETFFKIFKSNGINYSIKLDSTDIKVISIVAFDFNKDSRADIVISGSKNNKPFLTIFKNLGGFNFSTSQVYNPVAGQIAAGDFDYNGLFDLIASGINERGVNQIKYFKNVGVDFFATDSLENFKSGELSLADFNSDGKVDLSYLGKTNDGKKAIFLRDSNSVIIPQDTLAITSQRWGDYDRDGDLDLLQVRDSSGYQVFQILENVTVKKNAAPTLPFIDFTVRVFKKILVHWSSLGDDHTNIKSLTYDLMAQSSDQYNLINPSFDLKSSKRLTPSYGNVSTNTGIVLPNLVGDIYFTVQSIDNAYNGSQLSKVAKCNGKGSNCERELTQEVKQVCKGDVVKIVTEEPAHWFSFKKGYIGFKFNVPPSLDFVASESDTLVSVLSRSSCCCYKATTYIIHVNEPLLSEKETKYVCVNDSIKLGIPSGYKSVTWTYGNTTVTTDSIHLKITKPLTVNVSASTSSGCVYKKEFHLEPSIIDLRIENDQYTISQGESVQLVASGGKNYVWLPPTGLNNNQIANPLASPTKSITYKVTATDSIGCTAEKTITVNVEETAFAPTLFTPNGDGKNDEFKLYGLTNGKDFDFMIYNREGSTVYETTSISQATSLGWNGTAHGTAQPAGLYYWKIIGTQDNGQPLRLNGKTKGSVLLVR
ncbi:MAG: FG-GAP-like repeat-containing protein [Cyclobacteriaceae bacterium]